MRLRVVVDDHAGIQQVGGVEERLDPAHQVGGLPAPFHLDKRSHVAARPVLGLERTVVLVDDKFADVVHEAGVTLHLRRIREILGKHEMQIAFERMPEDDSFAVAVLA
ncbi:MAG: hypothetical protein AW09_003017 [Candidatus Accumulibacter phosphatis]|uniref:Uncharacterized protein n=1 Tax=Candidatus Accumulibacter phosphatis TaxID=327160 RepID=A0A080LTJ4_9PROT|nr:MAG: hypothetical protein AW09_003017 [Candidatus Accumulibacter phosphatis]